MIEIHRIQELEPLPKPEFLLVTTPDGSILLSDSKKAREWIRTYHPDWNVHVMPLHAQPQGVHIIKARNTLCELSFRRKLKWGQNLEDAFQLVAEAATCPTCIGRNKVLELPSTVHAVLKPWDWQNIHEDYRPGGSKYHGGRQ